MFHHTLELAALHKVRLAGAVTWAFEFEDQPWFEGFERSRPMVSRSR